MTLGRLFFAWLPVGLWFLAGRWAAARITGGTFPAGGVTRLWAGGWTLAEAAGVTAIAALWFDSLGSGGWLILFVLLGVLAAFPMRLERLPTSTLSRRSDVLLAIMDTARYAGAGAILAWRLGS